MRFNSIITLCVFASLSGAQAESPVRFEKLILTDKYYCDGIASGDINGDGKRDVIAGPFWYEGPEFRQAHPFYKPVAIPAEVSPSNSMFSFVRDLNGDGRQDIAVLGRVHKHVAKWYENPGRSKEFWKSYEIFERVRGESPTLTGITDKHANQLLTHWNGRWGWLEPQPAAPTKPWRFRAVGEDLQWPQFYHGQGIGDLNGDGRRDIVLNDGWYEQPAENSDLWPFHRTRFSQQRGGAQMLVYDVDGDGDQDVISSLHAHEWGLAWFEQQRVGDALRFRQHMMMGDRTQEKAFGVAFTQPHALALADIDGDGLQDVITGKRRWAHGPKGDIEPNAPPVVYWFRLTRTPEGVRYEPHLIDDHSGVGVQIEVSDLNSDGRPDVLTASKLGAFVFLNRAP